MSLWGPALDAEIEYRQTEARRAWGGRQTSRSGSTRRAARHAEHDEQRSARPSRAEQIRKGIAGMRPASTGHHGLFA